MCNNTSVSAADNYSYSAIVVTTIEHVVQWASKKTKKTKKNKKWNQIIFPRKIGWAFCGMNKAEKFWWGDAIF